MIANLVCFVGCGAVLPTDPPSIAQIDSTLTIEFQDQKLDLVTKELTYTHVKAMYGPTTLYADELVVSKSESKSEGRASGKVRVVDPFGTMTADYIVFDWKKKTGKASRVTVRGERAILDAKTLDIDPTAWVLHDVTATTCGLSKPVYRTSYRIITIQAGKKAVAKDIGIEVFGQKILSLPSYTVSLDKRASGFTLPVVNIKENGRESVSWSSSYLLDDQTVLAGRIGAATGSYLKSNFSLTRSFLPASLEQRSPIPRSDLSERFSYGFYDSIMTGSPQHEHSNLTAPRNALSVGTTWNTGAPVRLGDERFNKPIELVYELGGESNGIGLLGQTRVQRIQTFRNPTYTRVVSQGSILLPEVSIVPQVFTHVRLDGASYLNEGSSFGWGQLQAGLVYRPLTDVDLGAVIVNGGEGGTPLYEADRLTVKSAFHVRAQWGRGPSKIGFLAKYDLNQRRWYDDEISFSQVAGCFEPFVAWRREPKQLTIGISLRSDSLFQALTRRGYSTKID